MTSLECSEKDISCVGRLITRLSSRYNCVEMDDLQAIALAVVPRAKLTYDNTVKAFEGRSATFTTWLTRLVRNDLLIYIDKEVRARNVKDVLANSQSYKRQYTLVELDDEVRLLRRVLSPLAWRALEIGYFSYPRRPSNLDLSRSLGVSENSAMLLRKEVRDTVRQLKKVGIDL